jgi:hypothetical protein
MTINKPVLSSEEITSYGANGTGITDGADYDMLETIHRQEERRLTMDDEQGHRVWLQEQEWPL